MSLPYRGDSGQGPPPKGELLMLVRPRCKSEKRVVKKGTYARESDAKRIQRYL